ncbi:uncharacterized protein METZ01_LOCUS105456, partial [marine metagenome]
VPVDKPEQIDPILPSLSTHYPNYLKRRVVLEKSELLVGYVELPSCSCRIDTPPIQANARNLRVVDLCPEFLDIFSWLAQVVPLDDVELPAQRTC